MKFPIIQKTFLVCALFSSFSIQAAYAGGGEGVTSNSITSNTNTETNPNASISSNVSSTGSTVGQQTGIIQFNNSGVSNLSYPNCNGACAFAMGRAVPLSNGTTGVEAIAGVIWQFSSPENIQAQSNRLLAKAESERLEQESTVALASKLADALETDRKERANLLAIILAKRLGYSNYIDLLQNVRIKN